MFYGILERYYRTIGTNGEMMISYLEILSIVWTEHGESVLDELGIDLTQKIFYEKLDDAGVPPGYVNTRRKPDSLQSRSKLLATIIINTIKICRENKWAKLSVLT